MIRDPGGQGTLDQAAQRLERAVSVLEQRLADRLARRSAEAGGLFDQDRARLADQLDAAQARQTALEAAGRAASLALGEALAEIDEALASADSPAEAEDAEAPWDESVDDEFGDEPAGAAEED